MNQFAIVIAAAVAVGLNAVPAQAQANRTFVSGHGSDSNPCSIGAPCRSFAAAILLTNPGGEIDVLDPAGYGAVTITKSISIQAHGFSGITVASGATGITINAAATDVINLSGLIIDGAGAGFNGIQFATGKFLTIQNCVIRNLTNRGIEFAPSAASSLAVSDTLVADNGVRGIIIVPSGNGSVAAVLNRVEVNNHVTAGIIVNNTGSNLPVRVTVTDSVAMNNGIGLYARSDINLGQVDLMVVRSVIANNNTGLLAESGADILLSQSTVIGNTTGWSQNGGFLASAVDNTIERNSGGQTAPGTYMKK